MKLTWNHIIDKFPQKGQEVIVCSYDDCFEFATFMNGEFIPWEGEEFYLRGFQITHWMKVPKPPDRE